jgi:hypothetical protein
VALNAGNYAAAMPAFEELTAYYVAAENPEPWLVNSLSWASGKFADHFRERPQPVAEYGDRSGADGPRADPGA